VREEHGSTVVGPQAVARSQTQESWMSEDVLARVRADASEAAASSERQQRSDYDSVKAARRVRRRTSLRAALYLTPAMILLFVWDVFPILFGAWISLWSWGIRPIEFVGLANYERLFDRVGSLDGGLTVGEFGQSLLVTVFYAVGTVPVSMFLGFLAANLLFQKVRGMSFFRTSFFLPYITSTVAAGLAFVWIFNPTVGVANSVLVRLGFEPQTWLLDPDPVLIKFLGMFDVQWPAGIPEVFAGPSLALTCVIVFTVWNVIGFNIVILLAGLTSINPEVLDAGKVDGASAWQRMRYLTFPLLSPTLFFLLIISTIRSFQSFNDIYVLTGGMGSQGASAGGPLNTTLTLPIYMFRYLFERPGSVGYAAAVTMVLFALLMLLTVVQFWYFRNRVHYDT
jgi:ABC-type sugar transport system permease subunit